MVIATDSYTVRPGIACMCVCVCVGVFGRTETPGLGAPPLPRIGRIQTASEREHAATPRGDPTRSAEWLWDQLWVAGRVCLALRVGVCGERACRVCG
jgi:hypothetical protein